MQIGPLKLTEEQQKPAYWTFLKCQLENSKKVMYF
jgi:hypothetical protein